MLPPLSSIRERRKKLGWTQRKLAVLSGVSQSAIAKIERGEMNPTYEVAKRIFLALEDGEKEEERLKAEDVMNSELIWVKPRENVKKIRALMKNYAISQVPVMDEGRVVGMVTESDLLDAYERFGDNADELFAADIMSDPPPMVPTDTPLHVVLSILKEYQSLLVMEGGEVRGIITRADIVYHM